MTVFFIEPVLAHYRKDLYKYYADSKDFKFTILAGNDYQGIESIKDQNYWLKVLDYIVFSFFKQRFYYLKRSIRYILLEKPDIIICSGVDFHHIHTFLIYIVHYLFLRKDFYWWSHAGYGNQGIFGKFVRKIFYKFASGTFVYSIKGKENLLSMGVNEEKIQVINNAINNEEYGFNHADGLLTKEKGKDLKLLFCGRITENKKLDVLLYAIQRLKFKYAVKLKCKIIGSGESNSLLDLSEKLGIIDEVEFVGAKYDNELFSYYQTSDIFVYPGGIGLSLLQALSFGLPVITTDNIALHGPEFELLVPGENGGLFKDNSPEHLAEKIIEWNMKLSTSKETISNECIKSIKNKGYLPEIVSSLVISYLNDRYKK